MIPPRQAEAEAAQADLAFQMALAQVGAGTLEDALELWQYLDPNDLAGTAEAWLEAAVHLILTRRRLSRDLGMAYYRLVRALRTGKTVRDPFKPDPPYVTIDMLRNEFAALVQDIDVAHSPGGEGDQDDLDDETELLAEDDDGDTEVDEDTSVDETDRILLEELEELAQAELEAERETEEAIRRDLAFLGPNGLQATLVDLEEDDRQEQKYAEAVQTAGARVAASAERHALNGGRGSVFHYSQLDKRVLGFARVSLSGDPCHFCAMLISRGAKYRSERSGSLDSEGDLYHDNCRCIAVPIFSESQYETSPAYEQNRILQGLWKKGMSLQEWRHLIDAGRRSGDAPWVIKRGPDAPDQESGK